MVEPIGKAKTLTDSPPSLGVGNSPRATGGDAIDCSTATMGAAGKITEDTIVNVETVALTVVDSPGVGMGAESTESAESATARKMEVEESGIILRNSKSTEK